MFFIRRNAAIIKFFPITFASLRGPKDQQQAELAALHMTAHGDAEPVNAMAMQHR